MMWLPSIFYFISAMVVSQSFVITKYDPKVIADYFHKIRDYTTRKEIVNDSFADDFFAGLDLFEYCHELRQSAMFRMVNIADSQPVNYTDHIITKQQLETEEDKIEIEKLSLRVINLRNQSLKLNAFRCLDLEGAPRWIITPGYIPQSAFLFTYGMNFKNIETRNLDRSKEILVNLMGMIDDSGTLFPGSSTYILHTLMRAANEVEENQLCNLHPIIQYRLCAIVGDTLRRRYGNEEITSMGDYVTTQNYRGVSVDSQYYVAHPNTSNTSSEGQTEGNFLTHGMIHCPITIPDFMMNLSLYLRQNKKDPTRVLMVWYYDNVALVAARDVGVPLLKYIRKYQEALKNGN